MLDKIKAWCRHSLTIGWAYVLGLAGAALQALPAVADVLGVPEINQAVTAALGPYAGAYTVAVAVLTYFARMRSLRQAG